MPPLAWPFRTNSMAPGIRVASSTTVATGRGTEDHSLDKTSAAPTPRAFLLKLLAVGSPAVAWACVGVPFDVVRARLQTTSKKEFSGPLDCVRSTLRNEGLRAFWKGFTPTLLGSLPYSTIMFGTFEFFRPDRETEYFNKSSSPSAGDTGSRSALSPSWAEKCQYYAKVFVAGASAGIPLTIFANPLDVWRTRVQTQGVLGASAGAAGTSGESVLKTLRLHKHLLLRGTSMTLVRNLPGNGCFFVFNEVLNLEVMRGRQAPGDTSQTRHLEKLLSGGLTGIAFNFLFFPFEVVKARLMVSDTLTVRQVTRALYREMGLAGFFRGVTVVCLKAFPVNAAGFWVLHLINNYCK